MDRQDSSSDYRPSPIAGQWYPDDPRSLAADISRYINEAGSPPVRGQVVGILAPHAGYLYSGPVAGYAFAALSGMQPDLVAVISPMHHPYPDPLLTTAHAAYRTPFGPIPVDRMAVNELDAFLQAELGFGLKPVHQDREHALEIELPFLQHVFQHPFRLLPIMVRDQSPAVMQVLGFGLAHVLRKRAGLLVASSDLSHFYPQSTARSLDNHVLDCITALDPEAVLAAEETGKGFACGRGAIASMLWASQELGADSAQILRYATSGDITGDTTSVVGYGAAVITRSLG